jgi:hypothetical protein
MSVWLASALMPDSITQKKREGEAERCQEQAQLARKNSLFDYTHLHEFLSRTRWLAHGNILWLEYQGISQTRARMCAAEHNIPPL